MPKSPEVTTSSFSPEMTLSRLHDYNNLAAYFSSHAAAAAMASSANAASQVRMFQTKLGQCNDQIPFTLSQRNQAARRRGEYSAK